MQVRCPVRASHANAAAAQPSAVRGCVCTHTSHGYTYTLLSSLTSTIVCATACAWACPGGASFCLLIQIIPNVLIYLIFRQRQRPGRQLGCVRSEILTIIIGRLAVAFDVRSVYLPPPRWPVLFYFFSQYVNTVIIWTRNPLVLVIPYRIPRSSHAARDQARDSSNVVLTYTS